MQFWYTYYSHLFHHVTKVGAYVLCESNVFFFLKEKNVMVVEEATIHKKIEPNSATNKLWK